MLDGALNPEHWGAGQVLERLNGTTCNKIFDKKSFADVRYIRRMLVDVFTALDLAQRKFGFHRVPPPPFSLYPVVRARPHPVP